MDTDLLEQARRLSVQEQLELVEALWNSIADSNALPQPTAAQQVELDRRLADFEASPDDMLPWSEVRAAALAHMGR